MQILYHKNFLKNYKKRIVSNEKLDLKFKSQLEKFLSDSSEATLKNHKLAGRMKTYWSFSATGDVRVIYQKVAGDILLYDIETHNQVY